MPCNRQQGSHKQFTNKQSTNKILTQTNNTPQHNQPTQPRKKDTYHLTNGADRDPAFGRDGVVVQLLVAGPAPGAGEGVDVGEVASARVAVVRRLQLFHVDTLGAYGRWCPFCNTLEWT